MPAHPSRLDCVGTWLSLVEHSLGVRGVGSSNLPVPTINSFKIEFVWVGNSLRNCRPAERSNSSSSLSSWLCWLCRGLNLPVACRDVEVGRIDGRR